MTQSSLTPASPAPQRASARSILEVVDADARLDDAESAMIDQVRRLVETRIAPRAAGYDESRDFPRENMADINALGLNTMFLPEDYGGAPLSYAAYLFALREISSGCASTGLTWATNFHATNPIIDSASTEQLQRFLPVVAEGGLAAIAITEASGGSDATAMSTRFVPDGDEVIIQGEKLYITNGDVSDMILVFGKWAPLGTGKEAISAAVVTGRPAGLEVRRRENKVGHRASSTTMLGYCDVRIPRANLIGKPGTGLSILQTGLNKSRPSVAAHLLGIAQAAIFDMLAYGAERKIRGRPVTSYQTAQFKVAEVISAFVLCNTLMWRVARMEDPFAPEFGILSGMLKLRASEVATLATEASLQMHGGAGYCREFRAERLWRDARLGPVGEGASEMLLDFLGRSLTRTA